MSKGKLAIGAVFGAVAGFVTGVLLAPKSGKETRKDIKGAALKAKNNVVDEAEKAKDFAEEKVKQVRNKAETVVDDVAGKANDLKNRAEQAVEGAKKGFNKKPTTKKK